MDKLFILFFLSIWRPQPVWAEEVLPHYTASPSAVETVSPKRVTCNLKVVSSNSQNVPATIQLLATSMIDAAAGDQFTYDFGDGQQMTGNGHQSHEYFEAGTYVVRATPVVNGALAIPTCQVQVTLMASVLPSPSPTPSPMPSPTPLPTPSPVPAIKSQPDTGPSNVYWLSLSGLFVVWLGAVVWYRRQRPLTH